MDSDPSTGTRSDFGDSQAGAASEVRPPRPDEALSAITNGDQRRISTELLAFVGFAVMATAWVGVTHVYPSIRLLLDSHGPVVERIIRAESNGKADARNSRSSAAGAGQFLDQTWIEMIRAHRRDLLQGRSENEILELRGDRALAREMVARMVEKNAAMLKKRGLPVTPGTLYLAHFAGPAGVVAALTASEDTDAASVLASADARGRSTRAKLVKANPFLETFTVGDLKVWADRRMGTQLAETVSGGRGSIVQSFGKVE